MKSNSDVLVKVLWHRKIPNLETTSELKFKVTELKCKATSKLHGHINTVESNENKTPNQHGHNIQLKVHSNSFCREAADTLEALLIYVSCNERWFSCSQTHGDSRRSNGHTQWRNPRNHTPSIPKAFTHLLLHKATVKWDCYLAYYFLRTWDRE